MLKFLRVLLSVLPSSIGTFQSDINSINRIISIFFGHRIDGRFKQARPTQKAESTHLEIAAN